MPSVTAIGPRAASARAFVRSLNILLKFTRMYDFGHARTEKQFHIAWGELRTALSENETGLLLAVSGDQLLLDGVALQTGAAEKSFAQLLSNAGIASIHFAPCVTLSSLGRFVRAFPITNSTKPTALAQQLKAALEGDDGIHINEVCYIPADSALAKGNVAAEATSQITAQIAEQALGSDPPKSREWFNDPAKLLQLIAAAEGARGESANDDGWDHASEQARGEGGLKTESEVVESSQATRWGKSDQTEGSPVQLSCESTAESSKANRWAAPGAGGGIGSVAGPADPGPGGPGHKDPGRWALATAAMRAGPLGGLWSGLSREETNALAAEAALLGLEEEDLRGILQFLLQLARASRAPESAIDRSALQSRLSSLPARARVTLRQALSGLASQAEKDRPDESLMLKLAEHVAIRFALERYRRGEVQVHAVQELLDRMGREIEGLRKIVGVHEARLARAGLSLPTHAEILAQRFWMEVPKSKRQEILRSPEAWCIPPRSIRELLEELRGQGEENAMQEILRQYASCLANPVPDVRRKTAMGLSELAALYASSDERLLASTLRDVGLQLTKEHDPELQSLVSAAFVRLSQEAAGKRSYLGVQRAIEMIDYVEGQQPGLGHSLRPRVAVENRIPEFIEEALREECVPAGLTLVLRRTPQPAAELLAARFSRSGFRADCERLLDMLRSLGPEALEHLAEVLRVGSAPQAIEAVGVLSREDPQLVERVLPERMKEWKISVHDRVVRSLASGGASGRGRLLLAIFDALHPLVRPLAVDEIGMSGERSGDSRIVRIAEGELPDGNSPYLQLKAIEALGRQRAATAVAALRRIAETRQMWRWANPSELRIAAIQALEKIDPEWADYFIPRSGLSRAELSLGPLDLDPHSPCIRQRRYARLHLGHALPATAENQKDHCRMEIQAMNLGGGVATSEQNLHPGTLVFLKVNPNLRPIRAQALVRDTNAQVRAFEVVEIDLEERTKLRRLLVDLFGEPADGTPAHRNRFRSRTILTSPT